MSQIVFARVAPNVRTAFYAKVRRECEHTPAEIMRRLLALYLAGKVKVDLS